MATRKTPKTAKKAGKKSARKPAGKVAAKKAAAAPARRRIRPGFIAHTELASADPRATRQWCQKVLGWRFGPALQLPGMEYHMWDFGDHMGGGIRPTNPSEPGGSIPYCEVPDIQAAYAKALKEGAAEMLGPQEIPGGMGWVAIVQAPGGVPIGFWSTA